MWYNKKINFGLRPSEQKVEKAFKDHRETRWWEHEVVPFHPRAPGPDRGVLGEAPPWTLPLSLLLLPPLSPSASQDVLWLDKKTNTCSEDGNRRLKDWNLWQFYSLVPLEIIERSCMKMTQSLPTLHILLGFHFVSSKNDSLLSQSNRNWRFVIWHDVMHKNTFNYIEYNFSSMQYLT